MAVGTSPPFKPFKVVATRVHQLQCGGSLSRLLESGGIEKSRGTMTRRIFPIPVRPCAFITASPAYPLVPSAGTVRLWDWCWAAVFDQCVFASRLIDIRKSQATGAQLYFLLSGVYACLWGDVEFQWRLNPPLAWHAKFFRMYVQFAFTMWRKTDFSSYNLNKVHSCIRCWLVCYYDRKVSAYCNNKIVSWIIEILFKFSWIWWSWTRFS